MHSTVISLGRCATLLLGVGLVAAAPGRGQEPAPPPKGVPPGPARPNEPAAVHRMEIYEGPNRTVRYFGPPGDRVTLLELERAENDLDYARNLEALKRQYVNSERILEPQRRYVQEQLYGVQISYGTYNSLAGYGYGYNGGPGYYYPYAWPYNYGGYGGGFSGYLGGSTTSVVRSLAYGMGDEGVMKSSMAAVIAKDAAAPDYAANAYRSYSAALARVPALRGQGAAKDWGPVTVILKGGEKVEGTDMHESGDWYVVEKANGARVHVRKSEVTRIDQSKP